VITNLCSPIFPTLIGYLMNEMCLLVLRLHDYRLSDQSTFILSAGSESVNLRVARLWFFSFHSKPEFRPTATSRISRTAAMQFTRRFLDV